MIWQHKGRKHWTCLDIKAIVMEVSQTKSGRWLFVATKAADGSMLEKSLHDHPLDAMKMHEKYKEMYSAFKEEETRSAVKTPTKQAPRKVPTSH